MRRLFHTSLDAGLTVGALSFLVLGIGWMLFSWPTWEGSTAYKLYDTLFQPFCLSVIVGGIGYVSHAGPPDDDADHNN